MQEIYLRLEDADIIVFGMPIYWYGPTAKMKLLIDRLRPFIASRRLEGKKGIIVVPSEEGPECCGPIQEMFRMSFDYLGMENGRKHFGQGLRAQRDRKESCRTAKSV